MIDKLITWLFFKVKKTHNERTFVLRHLHEQNEVPVPSDYYDRLLFKQDELNRVYTQIDHKKEGVTQVATNKTQLDLAIQNIRRNSLRK